jgi:TolB-like protein
VRAAWISFVGRIIAQLTGSAATILLGLMLLHRYQPKHTTDEETVRTPRASAQITTPSRPRRAQDRSVAVLPLENFSADRKQDYLADAMTEALIAALSQADGLHVISRTSSMQYKGVRKPLTDVGRELGVDWIVESSMLVAEDRIRVIAQLIDTTTDEHIWAATYDRRFRDVLSVQAELVSAIAGEVNGAIAEGPRRLAESGAGEEARRVEPVSRQAVGTAVGTAGSTRRR